MHYGIVFSIPSDTCLYNFCMFVHVRTRMCMHVIICMYVCMCCKRRYVQYGILFPILQVRVFVCVHVCLLTYGHVYVIIIMYVCVVGGGTCTMVFCSPY